jgi:Dolichyl-phosphate-mannose-protein mannosyltransferase
MEALNNDYQGYESIKDASGGVARPCHSFFEAITVSLLTLLGAGIRLSFLLQPMRFDEISTFYAYSSMPVATALTKNHPPCNPIFHTFLVNTSTRIFGDVDYAIRLPAFICGVLMIPVAYFLFRELYNKWVGIMAAAMVVASSILIGYSTNARAYTVQSLLIMILFFLGIKVKRSKSYWGWAGIILVGTLALYTLPTSIYYVGALVVWMGLSAVSNDTSEKKWVFIGKLAGACSLIGVLTLLLYLPMILASGLESIVANPMVKSIPFYYFMESSASLVWSTWKSWMLDIHPVISSILIFGFLLSVVFHKKLSKDRVNFQIVAILWCLILLLLMRSVAYERHWIPLLPLFFGFSSAGFYLVGSSLAKLARSRDIKVSIGSQLFCVAVLLITAFFCSLVIASQSPYQNDPTGIPRQDVSYRDAKVNAKALKNELRPGDIVYIDDLAEPTLEYYFIQENIPVGYLFNNIQGARNPESPERLFVIQAFGEGHLFDQAVGDRASIDEIEKARIWKDFDHSQIFVMHRGR